MKKMTGKAPPVLNKTGGGKWFVSVISEHPLKAGFKGCADFSAYVGYN